MTSSTAPIWVLLASAACLGACLGACGSEPAGTGQSSQVVGRIDTSVPESWVKPQRWAGYWTIWADVRDLVGEERWAALDTGWMEEQARTDLAAVAGHDDYADMFALSGMWRLGMLRDEVLDTLAAREPDRAWPLVTPDRSTARGWQLRVELWLRAQPDEQREATLSERLGDAWTQAVAAGDPKLAARVVEARETWLGADAAPVQFSADAEALIRGSLDVYLRRYAGDWRNGRPPAGVIRLMERFGVPEGVDLDAVVAAARRYEAEMTDATMPLPHPYDLHVSVLRLQRLQR